MIDLYGMGSPNVHKIAIMLEELGLPYRFHHVEVINGQQFEPDFVAMSPNSKVPVLVDHDTPDGPVSVFESGAILIYLAEKGGRLLPPAGKARADALQWLMWQTCSLGPMLGQLNHFLFAAPKDNDYSKSRYQREAARLYRVLDGRMSRSPWLGGADYSVADIATYPWATYLEKHGLVADDFPALAEWRARVGAREAVQRGVDLVTRGSANDAPSFKSASKEALDRFYNRV